MIKYSIERIRKRAPRRETARETRRKTIYSFSSRTFPYRDFAVSEKASYGRNNPGELRARSDSDLIHAFQSGAVPTVISATRALFPTHRHIDQRCAYHPTTAIRHETAAVFNRPLYDGLRRFVRCGVSRSSRLSSRAGEKFVESGRDERAGDARTSSRVIAGRDLYEFAILCLGRTVHALTVFQCTRRWIACPGEHARSRWVRTGLGLWRVNSSADRAMGPRRSACRSVIFYQ